MLRERLHGRLSAIADFIWFLLFIVFALVVTVRADESGFARLFVKDGKPEGFVVRHWADVAEQPQEAADWTVRDGVLTSVGARGCWLISEKEYGDFVLEYEFKLGPRGNSGCALRAPLKGDPAFDGMELQMADFRYNTEAKDSELTGGIYRAVAPTKQIYRPEEWNTVRISLQGTKLNVILNGETIQDIDLKNLDQTVLRHNGQLAPPLKLRPLRGHIGFQELSRENSHVLIRNARIKELPPGGK